MTSRLPSLKAREVMRALQRAGFVRVRSKGSHHIFEHPDDRTRRTLVSDHRGKDVPRGTLHAIIEQAGLTIEEFLNLL
jgi:predicted RNA binding protein YcfA (HicA-like mRNA interferase family)